MSLSGEDRQASTCFAKTVEPHANQRVIKLYSFLPSLA